MTQPSVIYFGPDGGKDQDGRLSSKIYLRTLLYSSATRGRILESMFVRLRRGETSQNFNIWVYGEEKLRRGSGLFAPETGVAFDHHFLLPSDGVQFEFLPGKYKLDLFAVLVGDKNKIRLLFSIELEVSPEFSSALMKQSKGLYFDWGEEERRYHPHIRSPSKPEVPDFLKEMLKM